MENIVLSLFINGMMAMLLAITIWYCGRLNSRIRILQDSKSDLARIIREFDESTKRATKSIAEIHEATSRLSDNIQHKIDKANFLATDLEYMIEKGNKLAGKTETLTPPSRAAAQNANRPAREPSLSNGGVAALAKRAASLDSGGVTKEDPAAKPSARPRSRAEQELRNVLGGNDSDS